MTWWNCRLLELNGEPVEENTWAPVKAPTPGKAAEQFCGEADTWAQCHWEDGSDAIIEVEEFGGETGVHRMAVSAYKALRFSATPDEAPANVTP